MTSATHHIENLYSDQLAIRLVMAMQSARAASMPGMPLHIPPAARHPAPLPGLPADALSDAGFAGDRP